MGQSDSPQATSDFVARAPSQSWERLAVPGDPALSVWAWYKPSGVPAGLIIRIPDEVWQGQTLHQPLTMRSLLLAAGIDSAIVATWQLYGGVYEGMNGTNPLLDHPVPPPPAGVDPGVVVSVHTPQPQSYPAPQAAPPAATRAGSSADAFERIEADWNAILETENEIKGLRKNIIDMQGRLKALNRDLNTDERTHADSMDTRDWLEARRTLRDAGLRLSVVIKEVDMGDVSSAGQRSWFEQMYRECVVPRRPFDNMSRVQDSFAYHRKMLATLQGTMNGNLTHAQNTAERRAQQVLNRIAAKVRDAQTKKNFLGAMFDS